MNRRTLLAFGAGLSLALALGWLGLPALLYARAEQPLPSATGSTPRTSRARLPGLPRDPRRRQLLRASRALAKCADCHAEPLGKSADEKRLVEEFVEPGREIPWRVYARQPDNVRFPHALHVKRAGIACERCHGPHGASDTLRPFESEPPQRLQPRHLGTVAVAARHASLARG